MPDPPSPLLGPAADPSPMVLVDRFVEFVDELGEIIEETGGQPLHKSIESVLKDLTPFSSVQEWRDNQQRAIRGEIIWPFSSIQEWTDIQQRATRDEIRRHRAEVQEPAFAILRERKKASRPGAMRKEPVTFTCDDASYYRQVLDGIDPHLPQLPGGNAINSLTIGISWPPDHHLREYPFSGFITSSHQNLLALYFGIPSPGCYLVIDTWANSVAIAPPLPTRCVTESHRGIGTQLAILRHNMYGDYVLAELYLHQDSRRYLASNKATLFLWWSPGSGPLSGRWMHKEVVLPLPAEEGAKTATFHADMVFAVANTSLCWIDLQAGILVCDRIDKLATGTADDDLLFSFIPLPEECVTRADPLSQWRPAEDYRTMFCINRENIMFVCMDSYTQGCPIDKSMLTMWILKSPMTNHWEWYKHPQEPLCVGDLFPFLKNNRKLLMPSRPVISIQEGCVVTNLIVTEFDNELRHAQRKATGFYKLSIDANLQAVMTILKGSSPGMPFAASISFYLEKTMEWESLQLHRLTLKPPSTEEVIDEDECWDWVFPDGMDDDDKNEFRMKMNPSGFAKRAGLS